MTNQTRRKYAHYTSYGRLMVIYKKHRFICHPNFTAFCRLHIVSTSEFTAIATARSQVEVSECFSHQTIDCIVTKHAARIISSFYDVITFFKSLQARNVKCCFCFEAISYHKYPIEKPPRFFIRKTKQK